MEIPCTFYLHLRLTGKPIVDFLFVITKLFSPGVTAEALRVSTGSRRFFKGVGSVRCKILGRKECPSLTILSMRKLEALAFHMVQEYGQNFLLSQFTRLTDRETMLTAILQLHSCSIVNLILKFTSNILCDVN